MARSYPIATAQALAEQETDEVFLELIEINETSLPAPIRVVNNPQSITSQSNLYAAAGFGINLAGESDAEIETVRLTVDNVDRQMVDAVREAVGIPTVNLRIIRADDPDVWMVNMKFNVETAKVTLAIIEATLTYDNAYNRRFPRHRITAQTFPAGLF